MAPSTAIFSVSGLVQAVTRPSLISPSGVAGLRSVPPSFSPTITMGPVSESSHVAVRAVELSKQYDIYRRPIDRLFELMTGRARHTIFPALQEVSFDVEKGETV